MPPDGPPIYLDYQATTPVDRRVLEAMMPWLTTEFGNPHSSHAWGRRAAAAIDNARGQVARLIGAEEREIVFTSGATEANNLAIAGAARFMARHDTRRRHVVTVATEHKCVLESCRKLAGEGFDVTILPVPSSGILDIATVEAALRDDTAIISVMAANNEIGVLQDLASIGRLTRSRGILFHCDAAQAFGKIPLDVGSMNIDLLSISGHKIYAPKGIGALYVRHRPRVRLEALFSGGGQERGLRSGTLPTPPIVGLGCAAAIAEQEMVEEQARLEQLSRRFLQLLEGVEGVSVNGALAPRVPGSLNISFHGVAAADLLAAVPELALSTGSACTAASIEPSYVLTALGLSSARAAEGIRIGFGRFTSIEEVARAAHLLAASVGRIRAAV